MQKVEQQLRIAIGKKLRKEREDQGLMQKDLSIRMNVPHSRISEWEQGKTTVTVLNKYASALGVNMRINFKIDLTKR